MLDVESCANRKAFVFRLGEPISGAAWGSAMICVVRTEVRMLLVKGSRFATKSAFALYRQLRSQITVPRVILRMVGILEQSASYLRSNVCTEYLWTRDRPSNIGGIFPICRPAVREYRVQDSTLCICGHSGLSSIASAADKFEHDLFVTPSLRLLSAFHI